MKVFSSNCLFDYSWEEVSTANWRKYCPWNDKSTHVTSVDTLSRSVDPDTGILRTERLITCKQNAPAWVQSLLGGSCASYVHETSYVDPHSKKVTMVSSNLTWSNILNVRETVVYEPAVRRALLASAASSFQRQPQQPQQPQQQQQEQAAPQEQEELKLPEQTRFQQEAKIMALCGGWQKIRTKIEEASVEVFAENARKGREGFEEVLQMSRRVFGEQRDDDKAKQ